MVFGYSLAIVLFFPLYFLVGNAYVTTYGILILALLVNTFVFVRQWRTKTLILPNSGSIKKHWIEYSIFIGVMLIAAIPYLFSGVGNYWHSGSEDIFDGLNGRNAYLKNELRGNSSAIDVSTRVGASLVTSLNEKMGVTPKFDTSFFRDRYVQDPGRLQYSSLAFFSALLDLPKGMDVFIIQELLNLGFFALGVYAFARHVFLQKIYIAVLSTIFSVLGNFYLTTYVNGHEGSLMYNSAIPFILYFAVTGVRDRLSMGRWVVIPLVMLAMVLLAYPYPLPYVIAPVAAYAVLLWWADHKDKHSIVDILADQRIQAAVVILFVLGFAIIYPLAEPIRFRALVQFRSWGTAINHIGFLQFWGLWPSTSFSKVSLAWLDSQSNLKTVSLIAATALSAFSLFGFYRLFKQGVTFVAVWVPLWVFFFFVMRFAIYDSYYVYKFLYINAWIVISATVVAIGYLMERNHYFLRIAGAMVMIVLLMPNTIYNTLAFQRLSHRSFNEHPSSYYKILEVPRSILEQTHIAIPQYTHADLIRNILGDAGITIKRSKAEAQFILNEKGLIDIFSERTGEIVWESDIFTITRKPEHDIIELATYWQPENASTDKPFRWVSDGRIENALDPEDAGTDKPFRWVSDGRIGTVLVDVQQRSQNSNFMYICGESGPGIEFRPIEIKVYDAKRKLAGAMLLGTYGCHWVNISSFQSPFSLEHTEHGKLVSYVDNRLLVYRIMHIGFASSNSADQLPPEPQLTEDIYTTGNLDVPRRTISPISLGQNWYPFEKFGGESFRWVNNGAEVLLNEVETKGTLGIEAELGPSAGHPIKLQIADQSGKVLGICTLEGRKECQLSLQFDSAGNHYLQIKSDADGQHISSDPRILNFRIFRLEWKSPIPPELLRRNQATK